MVIFFVAACSPAPNVEAPPSPSPEPPIAGEPAPPEPAAPPVDPAAPAPPTAAVAPAPIAKPAPALPAPVPAAPLPAAAPTPAPAAVAVRYNIDPGGSRLYVQVFKDPSTAGAGLSHDHVVAATGWTASVTWDADELAACAVRFDVPVSGLVNDEPGLRKRVGYDVMLSDSQRADVKKNMLGSGQLDSGRFPTITYQSSGCAQNGDRIDVTGILSIHGVGKRLTVPLQVEASPERVRASGGFKLKASDFGFEPYTAMLGALKNVDRMSFTVDVVGAP